jgi:hypothetical protein
MLKAAIARDRPLQQGDDDASGRRAPPPEGATVFAAGRAEDRLLARRVAARKRERGQHAVHARGGAIAAFTMLWNSRLVSSSMP